LQCSKVKFAEYYTKGILRLFFETINTQETNEHLVLSLLDLNETEWTAPKVEHLLGRTQTRCWTFVLALKARTITALGKEKGTHDRT
jgi:hypothetical protein